MPSPSASKPNKAQQQIHKLDLLYKNFWNTPEGNKVLADLVRMFLPDKLSTDNPHTTAIRVGESNPVRYIQRRIKHGMDGRSVR